MTLSLEYNLLHNVTSEGIRTQNDQVESEEAVPWTSKKCFRLVNVSFFVTETNIKVNAKKQLSIGRCTLDLSQVYIIRSVSSKISFNEISKDKATTKNLPKSQKSLSRPWSRGEDDFSAFLKGGFHDEIGTRTPPRFVYLSTPKKGDRVSEKNVPVRSVTNFFLVPEKSRTLGLPRESVLFFWQVLWRCQLNPRFPFLLLLLLRQRNVSCGDRIIFFGPSKRLIGGKTLYEGLDKATFLLWLRKAGDKEKQLESERLDRRKGEKVRERAKMGEGAGRERGRFENRR